jgi:plasmid stabilization system protein ParE
MKVEYSRRAVADLRKISADSHRTFGDRVAEALESRIRAVVDHISREPHSSPQVEQRPGLHVVPLIRYPFKSSIELSKTACEFSTFATPRGDRGEVVHEG